MGCKCVNPSVENKNEIKSETGIKQTPLEPTTNRQNNNNENEEKNKKMKQYLIDEENNLKQYSDIHKNHDIDEPITFDEQKGNQNNKLIESNLPEKVENENNRNENNENNEKVNNENENNGIEENKNENNENDNIDNGINKENENELGNVVRREEEEDNNENKNNDDLMNLDINLPKEPADEFSKYIFQKINEVRKDPKSFIPIIEESKNNITTDKHGRLIYKSKVKVALSKGLPIFEEAISFLKETEPMDELIYEPRITIPVPDNEEDIKNKNYLKEKVEEINRNYYIKTYWRDIIKHPETSFILMIVDDTGSKTGLKRKDILNPDLKYIGISSVMIEKSFVCYMTFSEKL